MNADIVDIGNTLKLREDTDPAAKITNWFRQGLNIVDIMPAHFTLNLAGDNAKFSVYNTGDPIAKFQQRCKTYGLPGTHKMARLWLTGESTFQEEVSNEYQTNSIENMINGLMGTTAGSYTNMFRSVSAGAGQQKYPDAIAKGLTGSLSSATATINAATGGGALSTAIANAVNNVGKTLIKSMLSFKYLSVPKTYSGSAYNPALNFNVRLISPYGHPEAIQKFIVEPLTYLMLLAPPTTDDGVTYGNANYVSIRAYGIADIDLGIIENISIRRGGNDVAYNKNRQPLSIDVNLSIKPAAAGFAAEQGNVSGYQDKQHDTSVKVALDMATSMIQDANISKMKSSMTTLGNMLESFKPMPYPGVYSMAQSDPTSQAPVDPTKNKSNVTNVTPEKVAVDASKNVVKKVASATNNMNNLIA